MQVTDLFEVYRYFTKANLKNKILVQSEYQDLMQTSNDYTKPVQVPEEDQLELSNIKDDLVLI